MDEPINKILNNKLNGNCWSVALVLGCLPGDFNQLLFKKFSFSFISCLHCFKWDFERFFLLKNAEERE